MITLIEEAALAAMEDALSEDKRFLGTNLDVIHVAATPSRIKFTATDRAVSVEGRTVTFEVRAEDNDELSGEGHHTRVVVTAAKFKARRHQGQLLTGDSFRRHLMTINWSPVSLAIMGLL